MKRLEAIIAEVKGLYPSHPELCAHNPALGETAERIVLQDEAAWSIANI